MALRKCRLLNPLTQSIVHIQETRDSRRELEFEKETESIRVRTRQVFAPDLPVLSR
jgi:hypothetical protein